MFESRICRGVFIVVSCWLFSCSILLHGSDIDKVEEYKTLLEKLKKEHEEAMKQLDEEMAARVLEENKRHEEALKELENEGHVENKAKPTEKKTSEGCCKRCYKS